jgi:putative redox protein
MASLRVELTRIGQAAFKAQGAAGGELVVDGSPEIGGEGRGMRPMELLLAAIASCASMDVVHILTRQREPLKDLHIITEAERKDATPAPLTRVHLRFVATGGVDPHKLARAVSLSVEKYCSVSASLDPSIQITHEAVAEPA